MRILGLDFGSKTVGVAVSDELLLTAQGVEIIRRKSPAKLRQTLARIEELIAEYKTVEKIVLGYPKNMDGTLGPRAEKCAALAEVLREVTSLPVTLWDERRSTVEAHAILFQNGKNGKQRKKVVDAVAASLMLEGYLTRIKAKKEP